MALILDRCVFLGSIQTIILSCLGDFVIEGLVGCLSEPSVIFWTKVQNYRDCWEGSVQQYFQWLQDIFSLFCVLCVIFKMAAICMGPVAMLILS